MRSTVISYTLISLGLILFLTGHSPRAAAKGLLNGVVNVNTAPPSQLRLLPGIGPVKAQRILKRRKVKPFTSLKELRSLKGIGKKRLEALSPYVVFSGPSTAKISKKPLFLSPSPPGALHRGAPGNFIIPLPSPKP